jgi:hypothetical protein
MVQIQDGFHIKKKQSLALFLLSPKQKVTLDLERTRLLVLILTLQGLAHEMDWSFVDMHR